LQQKKVFNLAVGDLDPEDLRQLANSSSPIPNGDYQKLLKDDKIKKKIGATTDFDQCNQDVKSRFIDAGEVCVAVLLSSLMLI
jgi:UDP-glucose 6-dehydrogenase